MISINEAKRLVKRAILSNIVSEKENLAITPLVSGKHGIGKSAMIKSIAKDLGGVCITIEGGTLKEGEITGLPYQYKDSNDNIKFRFLPYYATERIQNEEKRIFIESGRKLDENFELVGDENKYAINDLSPEEKVNAIMSGKVHPVIIFIDEINRTENTVYKELMNILLTRSVNGYSFPWWVLFVGAMNPSTQNSIYATNEMDPAQLDRFIKIKVGDDTAEWLKYGKDSDISSDILKFIEENPKCLSAESKDMDDEEKPLPSPRGWDMVDTLLKSEPLLRGFFDEKENQTKIVEKDMKNLVKAKLGSSVATMFFASRVSQSKPIEAKCIFDDDESLSNIKDSIMSLSAAKKIQTCDLMLEYLKQNLEFMMFDKMNFEKNKKQLKIFVNLMDSSTKLLFAQNIAEAKTADGNSMLELLMDVFEKDLIDMLDASDKTKELIEGSK